MQIMTVLRALETAQQSNFISNSLKPNEELTEAQVKRMLDYDNQALLSANSTDEETLDRIYPELGTRFKGQFAESRRLFLLGMKNHSRADLLKSKELDDLWAAWYMTNRKRIEDAFNQTMP
ncbi:MAG: hypothetical protein GZ088_10465 [Acidipila sp.]|nr:hypothetical protein [Acidipila sp.]